MQPTGRILGQIIAPAGTDFSSMTPDYRADVDIGPRLAIGIGVDTDGSFVIDDLPPATYTVTIHTSGEEGNKTVGEAVVELPPGAAASVEIVLEGP